MRRYPKPNISAADLEAADQMRDALLQVQELPEDSQWEMALELLPDSVLLNVVRTNERKGEEALNLVGVLAAISVETLTGERANQETLTAAIYAVIFSALGELEKRYKVFSENVVMMEGPLDYDPLEPVLFIPKDPDTFSVDQVFQYYRAHEPALHANAAAQDD